jgi:hypothetical protein
MVPTQFRNLAVAVFLVLAVLLAGCGGGSGSGSGIVTQVTITPSSAGVPINGETEFSASVTLQNNTTTTVTSVTWEVNGTAGGNSTVGTIVASSTDVQVGIYTAPAVVPNTNNGTVNITAVAPQNPSDATDTNTVTSNTATVTVGSGLGLLVTPASQTISAGTQLTFSATLNGVPDANVTWSVTAPDGGSPGSIDPNSGLFTAPFSPPPGGSVTITATTQQNGMTVTAVATALITYSDASLKGPFAFSYSGADSSGFFSAAGSFVSDGNGNIVSGLEDIDAFSSGASSRSLSGTYSVGADGRVTVNLTSGPNTETWRLALTSNQHAVLIRFDKNITASGTVDQQNITDVTNPLSFDGPYVFDALGADTSFKPLVIGGKFSPNGMGQIPELDTITDINDNGTVTTSDTTLTGTYSFDPNNPGTGRGTIILSSTTALATQRQFTFYMVDATRLYMVESDSNSFLSGSVLSGPVGDSFSEANLASGKYSFTAGGNSGGSAFAFGGVLTSNGTGTITGDVADVNAAGTVDLDATLSACSFTVDPATGRMSLILAFAGATCLSGTKGTANLAAYQSAQGTLLIVELDANGVVAGVVLPQETPPSNLSGHLALNLAGQGIFHGSPPSFDQNVEGEFVANGTAVSTGNFDINDFSATFENDPINTTNTTLTAGDTNGRGTATVSTTDPSANYKIVYYLVNPNTTLLLDADTNLVLSGIVQLQF